MRPRFAEFALLYVRSQLRLRYRYAWLGRLWNILEPLLFLTVLSLVFSVVNRTNYADFALYLFAGLVPWRYFERCVMSCTDAISDGGWLIKKIAAPAVVLPGVAWLVATVDFGFSFVALLIVFMAALSDWTLHLLVLPLSAMILGAAGFGVGMIFAVLHVFARDIKPLLQMALMLLFFTSPVLIKVSTIPGDSHLAELLALHPLTPFLSLFQKPIYYHVWPSGAEIMLTAVVAGTLVFFGLQLVRRFSARFYFYV